MIGIPYGCLSKAQASQHLCVRVPPHSLLTSVCFEDPVCGRLFEASHLPAIVQAPRGPFLPAHLSTHLPTSLFSSHIHPSPSAHNANRLYTVYLFTRTSPSSPHKGLGQSYQFIYEASLVPRPMYQGTISLCPPLAFLHLLNPVPHIANSPSPFLHHDFPIPLTISSLLYLYPCSRTHLTP